MPYEMKKVADMEDSDVKYYRILSIDDKDIVLFLILIHKKFFR